MRKLVGLVLGIMAMYSAEAQQALQQGKWRAYLHRKDGNDIVWQFSLQWQANKPLLYILNADEKYKVDEVTLKGDSLFIIMPVFESSFKARIIAKDSIAGEWIKGTPNGNTTMPFSATAKQPLRFAATGKALTNLSGKWSATFTSARKGGDGSPAIALFKQQNNIVKGSILTPTGDYRFLEGVVDGNTLKLSTFDGSHAFLITATVDKNKISNGSFYSGAMGSASWTAVRNDTATLPDLAAMYLKNGEDGRLNFTFKDLDGKPVSIKDAQFKNKVVVIQLLGSWCPNCMDETAFLSDWYKKNHQRGVEIIGLAYEYSTDFARSQKDLRRFQQRFKVDYPMLITGVTVMDSLRTEKTLPQFTPIKTFPTSLVLDKKGVVRKIDTGFFGPGTGVYYENYKKEFEKTISELLAE